MQIEIKTDPSYTEPKVIIITASITDEVNAIVKKLSADTPRVITGIRNDRIEILDKADIIRIYAGNGKVFAVTDKGEYILKLRLYETEERLNKDMFVRISNSEIINIKKVTSFDCSLTGTICIRLSNCETVYASRRYVSKIKKILGL